MASQEKEKRDQNEGKRNQGSQQSGGERKQNQGIRSGGDREREGRTQKTSIYSAGDQDGCCRTKYQVRQVAVVCRDPVNAVFPHLPRLEGTFERDSNR